MMVMSESDLVEMAMADYDAQLAAEPDFDARRAMAAARPKVERIVRRKTREELAKALLAMEPEGHG
jgi:hypothetical protein